MPARRNDKAGTGSGALLAISVDLHQYAAITHCHYGWWTGSLVEAPMPWFFDNSLAAPVRPVCSKCGALMWLIRIEPHKLGCAQRTYECPRCQNQMTDVVNLEK